MLIKAKVLQLVYLLISENFCGLLIDFIHTEMVWARMLNQRFYVL